MAGAGYTIDVSECCCVGQCCCGCVPNQYGYCDTPGNLPRTLHAALTTRCGTFTGTLTFETDGHQGWWWGTFIIECQQITGYDGVTPIYSCRSLPHTFCMALGCGAPALEAGCSDWALELVCLDNCGDSFVDLSLPPGVLEFSDQATCQPFYLHWNNFSSVVQCDALCFDDFCEIVITE